MDDTDALEQDERKAPIERLKRQAEQLSGGEMLSHVSDDCPSEIAEQFWEQVVAYEGAESIMPFDELVKAGHELPPPDELDDTRLTEKLWELINVLAARGTYLHSTDHLNDRELYTHLWDESLREPTVMPAIPGFTYHIDIIGSGSEEDIETYLRYYADEDSRRRWAEQWPQAALPPRGQPPYDRDAYLPQFDFSTAAETADEEPLN
ncbi:MAG: hypothetical protein M3371_00260 [Acidobacteriota bacterium]|nr:hypothetical protein [Acidobacteriota bacterium]